VILVAAGLTTTRCSTKVDQRAFAAILDAGGPGFSPSEITVTKNHRVVLSVRNTTVSRHGISIDGYGIAATIDPGQEIEIPFRAGRAGTFRVFCPLHPDHRTSTLRVKHPRPLSFLESPFRDAARSLDDDGSPHTASLR
jgi:hypothetical protein